MVTSKKRKQNKLSPHVTDYCKVDKGSPDFKSMSIDDFMHWIPDKIITNKLFSIATPAVIESILIEIKSHLKRWLLVNEYPEDSFDILIEDKSNKLHKGCMFRIELTTNDNLFIVPKTVEGHALLEEYMAETINKLNNRVSRYETKMKTAYNKINEYAMRVYNSAQSEEIKSLAELLKGR